MKQGVPFRSIALFTSLAIVVPSLTFAEPLVEPGTCELIVAARPSLEEAKQYASGISDKRFLKIFEAENGWYAVSIGALKPEEEEAVMAKWKASGKIPSDAYCSTGEKYVAGMKWAPSETTSASVESHETNSGGGVAGALVRGMLGVVENLENPAPASSEASGGSCSIEYIHFEQNTMYDEEFRGGCAGSSFAGSLQSGRYTVTGPARIEFGSDRSDTILVSVRADCSAATRE